ncbi:MAG: DoxX family membrane protein [Dermatophilaceae bacterium]
MTIVRRIARPMLAARFVVDGIDQLRHPGRRARAAEPLLSRVPERAGIPRDAELLMRANGAVAVTAGTLLALGRLPRVAAAALALTLVPAALTEHAFWTVDDEEERRRQQDEFLQDVGLMGGLLLAAVDTAGRPGLAYRAHLAGESLDRARRGTARAARTTRREARHAARTARREARLTAARAQHALG